jgi:hypothetical protein
MYLIWIAFVVAMNRAAASYARRRAITRLSEPYAALPDILHDNLPHIDLHIPDYLLAATLLCLGIKPMNYRAFNCLLRCLTLRPIFVCLTTFPTCMPRPVPDARKNVYSALFLSTHDLMFSGHTCLFLFSGSVIGGPVGRFIKYVLPLSLIASRQHYTIDVIVSMLTYHLCW